MASKNPPSDKPLAGQHALVTGGGRGIGLAIAKQLATDGAALTLVGRKASVLEDAAKSLRLTHSVAAQALACDVTDSQAISHMLDKASAGLGPVTLLINNAGAAESAPFLKTDEALLNRMMDINVGSVFSLTRACLPAMISQGFGRIVNVASTAGLKGYAYTTAYCAAKHAVVGLTRSLALEVAGKGVTVNSVCPGFTDTDLVAEAIANIQSKTGCSAEEAKADLARTNPLGRLIAPEEVADAVAWLCAPSASAVTGQAVAVAGGEVM